MITQTWRFSALDTWFFKEARQMDTFGGSELNSVFPPPARTVMGAIRTALGEALGVDWHVYKKKEERERYVINGFPFGEYIGYGDDTGKLSLSGPWVSIARKDGAYERLYPVPRNLFRCKGDKETVRLQIDKSIHCDLGKNVRLPKLPDQSDKNKKYKPLEGWITQTGLEAFLRGETVSYDEIYAQKDIYEEEPRLGIARDNASRVALESLLYQTRHIRLRSDNNLKIAIEVDLTVDDATIKPPVKLIRFGGEGRFAGIKVDKQPYANHPTAPHKKDDAHGIILMLLTPALCDSGGWVLPGFEKVEQEDQTVWKGILRGIGLTIHSAVIGKAQREGGWNLAEHKSRPVTSFIPAGSLYYCTVDNCDIDKAIQALHLNYIEDKPELGRGMIAVGLWPKSENIMRKE